MAVPKKNNRIRLASQRQPSTSAIASSSETTYDAIITDSCGPSCYTMRSRRVNASGSASRLFALHEMTAAIFSVVEYAYTTVSSTPPARVHGLRERGGARRDGARAQADAAGRVPVLQRTCALRGVRAALVWARNIGGGAECVAAIWKGCTGWGGGGEVRRRLLGSWFVARPCAACIVRDALNELTISMPPQSFLLNYTTLIQLASLPHPLQCPSPHRLLH